MICRLCGAENLKLYYSQGNENQFKFYNCSNCKLVNYDLSKGLDQNKYSGKYIDPDNDQHKQNRTQRRSYEFIKSRISSKGKLLDIGCGNGKILLLAKKDGWDVKGIELSESYANEITKRYDIPVDVTNFLEYDNDECSKNNLVILRHVLEHLPDSLLAMRKINKLLLNNSYALLEFPNIESTEFKLKRLINKFGTKKKYSEKYKPGHCNEFCKYSFEFLLRKTGFELVTWELYSNKIKYNYFLTKLNIGSKARVLIRKTNDL